MKQSDRIRVALLDQQDLVLKGLRQVLSEANGFDVVAEAHTRREAVGLVAQSAPDLVVTDVFASEGNTGQIIRQIKQLSTPPYVMVLTADADDHTLRSALLAGADGFILKHTGSAEIVRAARVVASGRMWLDPAVTRAVVDAFRAAPVPYHSRPSFPELTNRELEVLKGMADGCTNAEIAARLGLGEGTVKTHVSHLLGKMGVRDRVQAVIASYEAAIFEPSVVPDVPDTPSVSIPRASITPPVGHRRRP